MYIRKAKIVNRSGIHGRAANRFTHVASQYESHVFVERADDAMKKANAKSIVFVLALCLNLGDEVIISAEGENEKEAVDALAACVESMPPEE